jgi:DNA polymerase alpha subunit B
MLPNPVWFTFNDIPFAMTSIDVLFHIEKGEFVKCDKEVGVALDSSTTTPLTAPVLESCSPVFY